VKNIAVEEFDTSGLKVNLEKQKEKNSSIPTKKETIEAQYVEGFFIPSKENTYIIYKKASNGESSATEHTYANSSWTKKTVDNHDDSDNDKYYLGADGWKQLVPVRDVISDGMVKRQKKNIMFKTQDLAGKPVKDYGPSEFHSALGNSKANFPAGSKVFHVIEKFTDQHYYKVSTNKGNACFPEIDATVYASKFNGNCNVVRTTGISAATRFADILNPYNSTPTSTSIFIGFMGDTNRYGNKIFVFKGANNSTDSGLFKEYYVPEEGNGGSSTYELRSTGTWKLTKVHGKKLMIFSKLLDNTGLDPRNSTLFVVDRGFVRQGYFLDNSKRDYGFDVFNKVAFDAVLEEYSK
jgi:hypothetical protein